ncbi:MAG TPA: Hpt domain-containing protein [Vicinamibacterales bacterium]
MGVAASAAMRSAETSVPIVDGSVLSELQTLGREAVTEIFDLFLADAPSRLVKLQHAIDDRSLDLVLREAHGLKGSALGIGASRLASLCAAIEHDAREGHLDRARARSSQLEPRFAEVRTALDDLRAGIRAAQA